MTGPTFISPVRGSASFPGLSNGALPHRPEYSAKVRPQAATLLFRLRPVDLVPLLSLEDKHLGDSFTWHSRKLNSPVIQN